MVSMASKMDLGAYAFVIHNVGPLGHGYSFFCITGYTILTAVGFSAGHVNATTSDGYSAG